MYRKIDIIQHDQLVKLCTDFYDGKTIENARNLLNDNCPSFEGMRYKKGMGNDRNKKNSEEILEIMSKTPVEKLPLFVAANFQNIPH